MAAIFSKLIARQEIKNRIELWELNKVNWLWLQRQHLFRIDVLNEEGNKNGELLYDVLYNVWFILALKSFSCIYT